MPQNRAEGGGQGVGPLLVEVFSSNFGGSGVQNASGKIGLDVGNVKRN